MQNDRTVTRRGSTAATLGLGTLALAGCASSEGPAAPSPPAAPPTPGLLAAQGPLGRPNPRNEQAVAEFKELEYLVGDWQGEGTVFSQQGEIPFAQTESVRYLGSGEMMAVEGRGTMLENPTEVMFRALAILRWDQAEGVAKWWAASDGMVIDAPFEARADGFAWAIESPEFSVRYDAEIVGDVWKHAGEMSLDGGNTWQPQLNFEVTRIT